MCFRNSESWRMRRSGCALDWPQPFGQEWPFPTRTLTLERVEAGAQERAPSERVTKALSCIQEDSRKRSLAMHLQGQGLIVLLAAFKMNRDLRDVYKYNIISNMRCKNIYIYIETRNPELARGSTQEEGKRTKHIVTGTETEHLPLPKPLQ